jgi:protein TonB
VAVRDDPWQRLPWLLPIAALLTLGLLLGLLRLLTDEHDHRQPLPPPLEIGLVELPAAASDVPTEAPESSLPETLPPSPPAVAAQPETPPPNQDVDISPSPAEAPAPVISEIPPPPPPPEPKVAPKPPSKPKPPAQRRSAPPPENTGPSAPSAVPAPAAPDAPPAANDRAPGLGNMGARALYNPLPEVPEALRRRRLELVAVARFRVASDGSATVELVEPTSDPQLNRTLLDMLRTWRFFPAMEQGRPVASSLDIRIPISVQ